MKYKHLLIVLFILPLCGCFEAKNESVRGEDAFFIQTEAGKRHYFDIELVSTLEDVRKGLMHRESLPEKSGMLFFFGDERERGFWMKNTLISLDMLFIKADGTIHHIHEKAVPHDLTPIKSQGPVAAVLEINGGLTRKLKIQEGDKVIYDLFDDSIVE